MKPVLAALALAALAGCSSPDRDASIASTDACDKVARYETPAQRFDETVQQLAHATGCFVKTDLTRTAGIRVNGIRGTMPIREALETAIRGTNLGIADSEPNTIHVVIMP
ncbi:STN domain-containing protein [Salinicola lusitanus]|uniref:STN domain-containing protein n=1 Tax=Salinicola lusitanus TaxID=1949085 RepID=UPI000DA12933|nr:STN domain-containing protein [Salinicola lusitanus]